METCVGPISEDNRLVLVLLKVLDVAKLVVDGV